MASDRATLGQFFIGANPDNPEEQFPVTMKARRVHAYVLGSSGVGKSSMLLDWILQDVMAGRGCAVIDPKGDLVFDILAALSGLDESYWPALAERLVLLDPSDPQSSVRFNPLHMSSGTTPARLRSELFSIFRKVWALDEGRTPRLEIVLRRATHLLMDRGLTLVDMPRVLSDAAFRDRLLRETNDDGLRTFWQHEFPASEASRFQWTSGALTRIQSFLDDPAIREIFSDREAHLDFRKLMDEGRVLLAPLSKGRLGEESAFLLGGFLMAKLQLAAESRAQAPPQSRRQFFVYIDEFQNYVSDSIQELLAEARGYGVSLVMAHQNLSQLDARLRDSILANAKIKACFRVSHSDAEWMNRAMFRVRGDRVKRRDLAWIKIGKVPIPVGFDYKYYSASEEARLNRDSLQYLPDRHLWAHLADSDTLVHLKTVEIPRFDRRVAEGRVRRFKACVANARQPASASRPAPNLPAVRPAPGPGGYEWSRPHPGRRPPRIIR